MQDRSTHHPWWDFKDFNCLQVSFNVNLLRLIICFSLQKCSNELDESARYCSLPIEKYWLLSPFKLRKKNIQRAKHWQTVVNNLLVLDYPKFKSALYKRSVQDRSMLLWDKHRKKMGEEVSLLLTGGLDRRNYPKRRAQWRNEKGWRLENVYKNARTLYKYTNKSNAHRDVRYGNIRMLYIFLTRTDWKQFHSVLLSQPAKLI